MNRNPLAIGIALLIGGVIGSVATGLYFHSKHMQSKEVFEQKVRCQDIAKRYEKNYFTGPASYISIDAVTFSSSRNSCIAKVVTEVHGRWLYSVRDLITDEIIADSGGSCNEDNGECGNGRDIEFMRRQDEAFKQLQ